MNGLRSDLVRTLTALLLVSTSGVFAAEPTIGESPPRAAPTAEAAASKTAAPETPEPKTLEPQPPAEPGLVEPGLNEEPLGLSPLTADAPAPIEGVDVPLAEDESLLWTLVRTFLVLGFVIACVYVVLNFGLRRMMGLKATGAGGVNALVTVVERIPLGPKQTLLVLKAAGEYLLVGSSDSGMNLIAKLQTEEVERLQAERSTATASMSPFLQKLLSRGGHPPPSA